MMNAGASRISHVQPDPTPDEYVKSEKVGGRAPPLSDPNPPTAPSANGSAMRKPPSITINCSVFTQAVPSSPPAVK
jgi:hypothetical protein